MKGGGGFWDDVNCGYSPEFLVLAARRKEIEWVHSEEVYEIVPMEECIDSGQKTVDLIWVDTDKSVDDPSHMKFRSRLCAREYKTKKQGKIQRALPSSHLSIILCNASTRSCESVGLNHDVCWMVKQKKNP